MTAEETIYKVLAARGYHDVLNYKTDWQSELKSYLMLVHPDKCSHPQAMQATQILNNFKEQLLHGIKTSDDIGEVINFPDRCIITSDNTEALNRSKQVYDYIFAGVSEHTKKYLPKNVTITTNSMTIEFGENRAIPIVSIESLPQEHLNWVLSRIFELLVLFEDFGITHAGITPESIYIVPETHGIICTTFYHTTENGESLKTISGHFSNFYPSSVFKDKKAVASVDIELAKRTAIFLAGDKIGSGSALKNLNPDWLNFVKKFSVKSIFDVFDEYRKLIDKNFEKKFHILNI